jgi:hypothetical protein
MKINLFIITVVLFYSCSERGKVNAPSKEENNYYTEISGNISGQLSKSDSPYLVTDEILVDSLQTLNIDPGVILHFTDSANLVIRGKLTAIGNKDNFIQFSAQNNSWKGIRFSDTNQNSVLQFAQIENVVLSDEDSTDFGAVEINNSSVIIKNCVIRENVGNNGAGIAVVNSNVIIKNNIFRENSGLVFGGGLMLYQSNSEITNNTFYNNFCTNCGSAIALISPLNENIQNNILFNNFSQTGCSQFYYNIQDSLNYMLDYNFTSLNNPDPNFVSENDLRLSPNSSCVDNGNPDSSYNDVDGTRNNQGAFGGPDGDW